MSVKIAKRRSSGTQEKILSAAHDAEEKPGMEHLTISAMMEILEAMMVEHGNLAVALVDAGTGWRFKLKEDHLLCLEVEHHDERTE
jgi:hypothetical protein